MANTIMMSEVVASIQGGRGKSGIAKDVVGQRNRPALCLEAATKNETKWLPIGRGSRWSDGALVVSGFQTVLPPNSPSCSSELGIEDSITSASSHHHRGVHVLMASGAILFATDSIDCGSLESPGCHPAELGGRGVGLPSPYGLWGAMGTSREGESLDKYKDNRGLQSDPGKTKQTGKQEPLFSIWTSKSGEVELLGKCIGIVDRKTIRIEDTSGIVHEVPLNSLSNQDLLRAASQDIQNKSAQ